MERIKALLQKMLLQLLVFQKALLVPLALSPTLSRSSLSLFLPLFLCSNGRYLHWLRRFLVWE